MSNSGGGGPSSPPSTPGRHREKEKDGRPRQFDANAKTLCWARADIVPGRHPERWRKDAAGNIVCKRFYNCSGCLCFEYDHIIPFSKGVRCLESFCLLLLLQRLRLLDCDLECGALLIHAAGGESVVDNCQILQTRVNRFKSDQPEVDKSLLQGYSCDITFTDKELDIIEMAVYGNVIRPGNQCRCRTVAEMLGKYKSKDKTAACKLPQS